MRTSTTWSELTRTSIQADFLPEISSSHRSIRSVNCAAWRISS